ncbi:hypothetical protein MZO42_19120 [Sphingomonas psychrotolerans]|uniref:Lipoprotein n=1 Tax=Sphingomonas psychrotolerans TaxID=1327635 RepID=A0ABU3N8I9_9SPHN|nr:hypothetical protein [Sphingomonas psychrotolerans]MDT8760819.1 hypothetical protein [Sphingomonas psychrotolerans]
MKLAALLSILLVSCGPAPHPEETRPEIIRGLSDQSGEGTAQLTRRAQAAFPLGSSEEMLMDGLRRQRFTEFSSSSDERGVWHIADYEEEGFPCMMRWSIRWRSKGKRITEIWAVSGTACL